MFCGSVASRVRMMYVGFCVVVVAMASLPACGQDAPETSAAKTDIYAVPDGTPEQIQAFIEALENRRARVNSRREAIEHAIRVQRARILAGDKILAQKTDAQTAFDAAQMKLEALSLLASAGIDGALKEALNAAVALQKDPRESIAKLAAGTHRSLRILSAAELKPNDRAVLIRELLADVKQQGTGTAIQPALELGEVLEQLPDGKVAADYYDQLAKAVEQVGNPRFEPLVAMLTASSRRLRLPGSTIKVTGTTVDGQPFDWSKYRGKVVLIDFWATWCGPCRAELPNVKQNYERYHAKGFEVVGISADEDLDKLTAVIKDEGIPWVNLFEPPKDGQAGVQPTAEYYGISALPTAILVGRDGKVITLMARGELLTQALEKLFAKDEPESK